MFGTVWAGREQAIQMKSEGMTIKAISEKLGVHRNSVSAWVKEMHKWALSDNSLFGVILFVVMFHLLWLFKRVNRWVAL